MLISVISLLITLISSTHEISDIRRWRLVPTARGARNLDSLTSISLHSHEEMVVPKMRRPHSSTRTQRNREEQEEDDIEDITRFENQIRRRVKRIGRKGRRIDERPLDRDPNPQKPTELEATTDDPSLPIHPVHRLQSKRKHFVIVAPTPPDATPEPIIQLSNQTNPEKPGENMKRSDIRAFTRSALLFGSKASHHRIRLLPIYIEESEDFHENPQQIDGKIEEITEISKNPEEPKEESRNDADLALDRDLEVEDSKKMDVTVFPETSRGEEQENRPLEVEELQEILLNLKQTNERLKNTHIKAKIRRKKRHKHRSMPKNLDFEVALPDGTEFKRDTETVQAPPSGLRVETDQSGTPQLEINPENLPDEYRRLLAKGYRSYPVFNSKNYKKPAQPLFEANLVPQIDAAQNLPQNLQNRFSIPTNQFPPAFQQSQQPPGVQILPGAQGGSFLVPQGLGGGQNVNLALLARARQLLALREYELIKAKQELMLQQARQIQLQQQFAQNQNRLGRAINGQPAQLANGQIDPLLLAELHNRQLFTAQLMAQAQQRAYHPEAALIPGNQQRFVIPQNLAAPPQLGGQFGSAYLAPLTENDQSQFNFSPGGNLGPTATFLSNGRQLEIPVVFKRAAQRNPQ